MIFERTDFNLRLTQIVFLEVVEVDDQDAVGLEVREIHFQRGGIHSDENVDGVTGGVHVVGGEVDLESADTRQSSGRGANLGREVGEGGQIVAEEGGGVGE